MTTDDDFVVLLRSSDATYVDQMVAALEAEGIPYEHPGKNHAALLPGFTYIEIQLRVPRSRHEEARALLAELQGAEVDDKTAFRVVRSAASTFTVFGLGAGILATILGSALRLHHSQLVAAGLLGAGAFAGFLLGRARSQDCCSNPSCGGPLGLEATACPKCGATIRGAVSEASQHFVALEALERNDKRTTESSSGD